jgi:dephospho-CoA kinase
LAVADVIIKNVGTYEATWRQVVTAWRKHISTAELISPAPVVKASIPQGEMTITRGKPRNSFEIAQFMNRFQKTSQALKQDDIMAAFGEKAFLLLQLGQKLMGVIGWQVENLVARTTDIMIDPVLPANQALPVLINEMERASRDLQCEASLIFVSTDLAKLDPLWQSLGYERRTPQALGILAWQEAAAESTIPDTTLFFKQLRVDRILRPI